MVPHRLTLVQPTSVRPPPPLGRNRRSLDISTEHHYCSPRGGENDNSEGGRRGDLRTPPFPPGLCILLFSMEQRNGIGKKQYNTGAQVPVRTPEGGAEWLLAGHDQGYQRGRSTRRGRLLQRFRQSPLAIHLCAPRTSPRSSFNGGMPTLSTICTCERVASRASVERRRMNPLDARPGSIPEGVIVVFKTHPVSQEDTLAPCCHA